MKPLNIQSLGELTTKQELAVLYGISRRSILNYDEVALDTLPEYEEDYPKANNKSITRYPLTRFQCWILGKIGWNLRLFSKKELTYFLTQDYEFSLKFSKEEFETIFYTPPAQQQIATLVKTRQRKR
ncbi:MAG: hypothetical protein KME46_32665 [Brasilonema angustatum HA4187-MV1]|jgi:hypothetical protein|nr:hypothetical protein [Brasilonema angustatum HA4187-MV1]